MRVLAISGSLRARSLNTALLRAAAGLAPPAARVVVNQALIAVPPYSEDDDVEPAPRAVAILRAAIADADALLFATPEYNASVPGQLKNAIDWASRPYPDNALRGKPAAVVGASTGIFGAVWAQAELRKILRTAGASVLDHDFAITSGQDAFDDELRLVDAQARTQLRAIVDGLTHAALALTP
jgi:chromate reductase, NAD(P)H dehydrogenase (quinone)